MGVFCIEYSVLLWLFVLLMVVLVIVVIYMVEVYTGGIEGVNIIVFVFICIYGIRGDIGKRKFFKFKIFNDLF